MGALSLGLNAPYRLKRWVTLLAQAALRLDFTRGAPLDSRVTFTRASGGTSFRPVSYGPDVITSVSPQAASISGQDMVENTSSANHGVRFINSTTATRAEFRFRAKAGTKSWVWAYFENYVGGSAWFDLTAGAVGTQEKGVTATIKPAADGFYDCVLTKLNFSAAAHCNIYAVTGNGSTAAYTGTGSVALKIASYAVHEVILDRPGDPIQLFTAPANVPRFDYDPVTRRCKGLLVEEQRTNLTPNSAGVSAMSVSSGTGSTFDGFADPAGGNGAVLLSGATNAFRQSNISATAGQSYTQSIYLKSNGSDVRILAGSTNSASGGCDGVLNLSTRVFVGTGTLTVTDAGAGWLRIANAFVAGAGGATAYLRIQLDSPSGVYFFGVQQEQGSFATSYIPTTGAAATRAADVASINTLTPWMTDAATLFFEYSLLNPEPNLGVLFAGTNDANCVHLWQQSATNAQFEMFVGGTNIGASGFANMAPAMVANKAACSFGASAYPRAASRGVSAAKGLTTGRPPMTKVEFFANRWGATSMRASGHVRRFACLPRALSDTELQGLTR